MTRAHWITIPRQAATHTRRDRIIASMASQSESTRITLRTLRRWAREGLRFAMLTCYDATTARWLWRGGVRTLLVGDTAAQMILGHDSTLPIRMDFLVTLTEAVRRGAPDVFLMADMPFGSYQCGDDAAVAHAMRFLAEGGADVVKLEVDESFAPLVDRLSHAGVPVVAHVGSRPQQVRHEGGYHAAGRTQAEADHIVATGRMMLEAGADMLLIEAVPNEVSRSVVEAATTGDQFVPVIGCGAGPACHGHVIVLHDLLGLTDWQPPFAPAMTSIGRQIADTARKWVEKVERGEYLKDDHPYRMRS